MFSRQAAMPHHHQSRLENATIAVVGCGGLGSWTALALARMGVRRLILVDPDRFDRSNSPRQCVMPSELGQPKAHALARAILPHMTNAGTILAVASGFVEAMASLTEPPSALAAGVDNNAARLAASRYALACERPCIFSMLSLDGLRAQTFMQLPDGPCLSCVLPDLDVAASAPCAAASIASCYLAAAHAVSMLTSAVMSGGIGTPTWREASLDGTTERTARPGRRPDCWCT
jgi:adenylyltransferase/sulfurtransferase